ncbi:MAG: hypothetical protein JWO05_1120 [Gemmatimonadetes bacterium]|nr:hypothetical protein [Gemmatimonadota bacterium]
MARRGSKWEWGRASFDARDSLAPPPAAAPRPATVPKDTVAIEDVDEEGEPRVLGRAPVPEVHPRRAFAPMPQRRTA